MSSQRLGVALIWHLHQPYYRSGAAAEFVLPWVRLRAAKDYVHMLDVIARHPAVRVTVNMVPSLLEQLDAYAQSDSVDFHRDVCLRQASSLDGAERAYLVEMALRGGFPRRVELFAPLYSLCARLESVPPARLDVDTVRDIQVWLQLGWIEPGEIRKRPPLLALAERGGGFREADKLTVDRIQHELVMAVIPRYRALVEQGIIEPMTSPAFHPIVPLIIDSGAARVATPDIETPRPAWAWPSDADDQIVSGRELFERYVGVAAAAVWPPECAVSPAAVARFARNGFRWGVSDEKVIDRSLGHSARQSGDLYRPQRCVDDFTLVFRDADLSDRIGFAYAGRSADDAVADLRQRLHDIAQRQPAGERWLCTIALDGENCWDFYEENGTPFLEALYSMLSSDEALESTHVGAFLASNSEAGVALPRLHSGSWIDADFTTWMGDRAHTAAWSLLIAARAALDRAGGPSAVPLAYREIQIVEGSDWFWWFGNRHDSGMDHAWDALFRAHLRAAYIAMNAAIPSDLEVPIIGDELAAQVVPLRPINPPRDGAAEWRCGGRVDLRRGLGSMHPPQGGIDAFDYGVSDGCVHARLVGGAVGRAATLLLTPVGGDSVRVDFDADSEAHHPIPPGMVVIGADVADDRGGSRDLLLAGRLRIEIPAAGAPSRRIVIVAAEIAPGARVGAVGDAVAAMASTLTTAGHSCVVIVPGHASLLRGAGLRMEHLEMASRAGGHSARVLQRSDDGFPILLIDSPDHFGARPIYADDLDSDRYVAFSRAAADVINQLRIGPDAVICCEWQSAVAAALLHARGTFTGFSRWGPTPVGHRVAAQLIAAAGVDPGQGPTVDLLEFGEQRAAWTADTAAMSRDPVGFIDQALSSRPEAVPTPVPGKPAEGKR